LKSVSGKRFCKVLEDHGWELQRIRGSHHIYGQPGNPTILTVPVHGNHDLKIGTLGRLLKDSGIDEDEL
jgi:predicted RNA binding protein YcfA (HicA-like mRNA interferase family)